MLRLVLILAVGVSLLAGPSAARADDILEVSKDGVVYGGSYPGALFDDAGQIVPGGTISAPLYVRNSGPTAGNLQFSICGPATDTPSFWNGVRLRASTPAAEGSWRAGADAQPCLILLDSVRLQTGQSVRIDTELALDSAAENPTQGSDAGMTFVVSLQGVPDATAQVTESTTSAGRLLPQAPTLAYEDPPGPDPRSNTARLSDEFLVVVPLVAATLAGVLSIMILLVRNRRRSTTEKAAP